jgi:hypothetical protein
MAQLIAKYGFSICAVAMPLSAKLARSALEVNAAIYTGSTAASATPYHNAHMKL